MAKYAVVSVAGVQHKVIEGQELLVDKLTTPVEDIKTLLMVDGDKVDMGMPFVTKAKIKVKVLEELVKGEKLYISKFKAKSRYRRRTGFRPQYSKLLIEKIS